jgi:transposase
MPESKDSPPPITSAIDPDLGAVRQFIADMLSRGAVAALVTSIVALLARMRDLNSELMRNLASKSRKRPPNEAMRRLQLELPLLLAPVANDTKREPPERKPPTKRGPKTPHPHGRPKLPDHLPRVPQDHLVPDDERECPACEVEAERIGFKSAEKLDIVPAHFIVRQVRCETVACQECHQYVMTACKGDEVLDRGILGNDLLVEALVDHYDDAVPYERMERNARQEGVPLSANTLASSVGRVIDLFDPIATHIRERCLASAFTALDATRMPVLDPSLPLGIRSASLWLVEGDHRYACFFYAPTGHAEHLKAFFSGRTLHSVMCDGSATNNCVEDAGGFRGGCNSHGRRGLVEALRGGDARAVEGLDLFARVFHVDAESKRLGETIEQRFERRLQHSAPLVERLRAWIDLRRADVEPKSTLGQALGYLHRQWKRLTAFLRDPRMELTNNEVERDLRRWVLNRKTWLFVGHDASARRAAGALTILATCRKFGINPRRYIRDTLAKLLAGEKNLATLLPEHYVAVHGAQQAAA